MFTEDVVDAPSTLTSTEHPLIQSPCKAWVVLLLLFLAVHCAALFSPALLDDADATHANAAQHMARSGDWVTLYVDGVRYLEKPPLPYWLVAINYHLFGYNVFATHLPMTLAVLANAILGWVWARRAFGDRAAFYTALALLTTIGVFLFTRVFIPESILCFFLALGMWAFLTALEDRKPGRVYLMYASLAVAMLAKGLIAPVFFLAAAAPYLLITGEWRRWRELRPLTGMLLFLAIAAPWHILAAIRNPDIGHPVGNVPTFGNVHGFLYFYFINEHVLRFLGKRYPYDYNKQPGWVFWVGHIAWLFPWCLFFPAAVRRLWSRRTEFWNAVQSHRDSTLPLIDREPGTFAAAADADGARFQARTTLLLGLYAGFILLFFSLSTNQEYYTFPAYFPLLLLLAGSLALQETAPQNARRISQAWLNGAHILLAVAGTASALALFWGLWTSRHLPYVSDIGELLAHRGVGDYSLAMSHFFDLTGPSFAALRLPASLAAVSLLSGPLLALSLRRRGRSFEATTFVALTVALFLVAAHIALVRFQPLLSSVTLANVFNRDAGPNDRLLVYGDQSEASSVLFYTHRQANLVESRSSSMLWGSFYPDSTRIFQNDAQLAAGWGPQHGSERLFLVVPPESQDHVLKLLGATHLFALKALADQEGAERTLYTDRPFTSR